MKLLEGNMNNLLSLMNNKKLGRFIFSIDFINNNDKEFKKIMSKMKVLLAEYRDDINSIEYLAISPLFEVWNFNDGDVPVYMFKCK